MDKPVRIPVTTRGEPPRGVLRYVETQCIEVLRPEDCFITQRAYWITHVGDWRHRWVTRGDHAHKRCRQIFFCLRGQAEFTIEDAFGWKKTVTLFDGRDSLYVPPMIWHSFRIKRGTILLVLASEEHSESEYIRDYGDFLKMAAR